MELIVIIFIFLVVSAAEISRNSNSAQSDAEKYVVKEKDQLVNDISRFYKEENLPLIVLGIILLLEEKEGEEFYRRMRCRHHKDEEDDTTPEQFIKDNLPRLETRMGLSHISVRNNHIDFKCGDMRVRFSQKRTRIAWSMHCALPLEATMMVYNIHLSKDNIKRAYNSLQGLRKQPIPSEVNAIIERRMVSGISDNLHEVIELARFLNNPFGKDSKGLPRLCR